MKTLIISDIHGSHKQLNKVLSTPYDYDQIILVGDLMYHGPRNPILEDYNPAEVANILNSINKPIVAVRGNCDSEVDQMLIDTPILSDYARIAMDGIVCHITHGHLEDPIEDSKKVKANLYISGHTHIALIENDSGVTRLNPGSISLPKSDLGPTYAFLDNKALSILSIEHEILLSGNL